MTDIWYKKLGFYNNPFSIKPAAFDDELVAYDLSYIYSRIEKSEMVFIEGSYGTGKTTILKNIIRKFKGKNKIIYYSFDSLDKAFKINELLDGANSFVRKIVGFKVKDVIMLLDEVHSMKEGDAGKLIKYYKDGTIKSVIFVSHDYNAVKFPEEVTDLLNGNIIRTVPLSNKEAISLVKRRIGNISILPDKIVSKLFILADKNPRRLLEYCEDVSRCAVEMGDSSVTDFHMERVFGDHTAKPVKVKKIAAPKKRKASDAIVEKTEEKNNEDGFVDIKAIPELNQPEEKKPEVKVTEIHEILGEDFVDDSEDEEKGQKREKKFKINKLVGDDKRDSLGKIEEKEEEAEKQKAEGDPEYKVYFLDNE